MLTDDLPWPELGNVSRGATRGNQGQKGALGPADQEGRCVLQLRVQPGVLAVRLNRRSSEWYRTLDNEVNRALKLTKTYWRKARRRQDYNARADQDHMELHEWLQQLKDKTMSHLEVLMQKGDIQGPPYIMPDDIELVFLRKFIERHNAGIPHNPRLRHLGPNSQPQVTDDQMEVSTPELSDAGYSASNLGEQAIRIQGESSSSKPNSNFAHSPSISNRVNIVRTSPVPSTVTYEKLVQEAHSSRQLLQEARANLSRSQTQTQEAFQRYTACLEVETRARREVHVAEQHHDELMFALLARNRSSIDGYSRQSSLSQDEVRNSEYVLQESSERRHSTGMVTPATNSPKVMEWRQPEGTGSYSGGPETMSQFDMRSSSDQPFKPERKHSRTWDQAGQLDARNGQLNCGDMANLPPRKRAHHMVERYDPSSHSGSLMSQPMPLPP
ncbi:hypothetical protein SERLA73DRAFT_179171 [Serpula lacrymans var. lacrymans S7.3]|uniref:Uncharacterized protein n=2 Tax=Serpula lacrymans var. lacrymans TaxID=341189 RepID=F8PRH2_SERL3|nr:uncharacterized protein SERLADRAFT_464169 [Serpula lacrymans var. lacrymans S7.9]EGO01111.1 hypothetical protein SERLA73DRAFT_179171 [Serpula lacrymans var. lacrymans S7.3]EGO26767.1 hypothetical protein SERLADRAFT_464169 [Serpula lacrymans var. lacrymans S7.9]